MEGCGGKDDKAGERGEKEGHQDGHLIKILQQQRRAEVHYNEDEKWREAEDVSFG